MVQMIRKQVYIQPQQQTILKKLSQMRGLTEAELIRQAIDRQLSGANSTATLDPGAWEEARDFMLALQALGPSGDQPRQWWRDDLYEERLSRHDRSAD